jgi:hypothetical protein
MTEKELEYLQRMGRHAEEVLANPAYLEAMSALKKANYHKWTQCNIPDIEAQKELLQMHRAVENFESVLRGMISTGKYETALVDKANIQRPEVDTIFSRTKRLLKGV